MKNRMFCWMGSIAIHVPSIFKQFSDTCWIKHVRKSSVMVVCTSKEPSSPQGGHGCIMNHDPHSLHKLAQVDSIHVAHNCSRDLSPCHDGKRIIFARLQPPGRDANTPDLSTLLLDAYVPHQIQQQCVSCGVVPPCSSFETEADGSDNHYGTVKVSLLFSTGC